MSAYVHGNLLSVLPEYREQSALHVLLLYDVLARLRIYGMVSHHYHPVLLRIVERSVYPCQLCLHVLAVHVGVCGAVVVAVYHRRSVYHDNPDAHLAVVVAEHLRIVSSLHRPASRHLAVVQHGLCVAPVFVVAENGQPLRHQFRVRVYQLVVGHPQRVADRPYASEVVYVAKGQNGLRSYRLRHLAHHCGNRLLVVISVTSQVVGQKEVDVALQLLPLCGSLSMGYGVDKH